LGFFHPANVVSPLSKILSRHNVTIATFQRHMVEFCRESRGGILERVGERRSYKYRFRDPLVPSYVFMESVAEKIIELPELDRLTQV